MASRSSPRLQAAAESKGRRARCRTPAASAQRRPSSVVQLVRSDYALGFSYTTRGALGTPDVFETFTASVVDAKSGRIVATGNFGQGGLTGKQVSTVLDEFVNQLAAKR